jgi:hypothetical protein
VSQFPLERVELIFNGNLAASGILSPDQLSGTVEQSVQLADSGWLSFRAFDKNNHQAHTSPIYVEVGSKRPGLRDDARFFLGWIDRLEAKLKERDRIPNAELKTAVEKQLNAARAIYQRIAVDSS